MTNTTIWSSTPNSGCVSKSIESRVSKTYLHICVLSSAVHKSREVEASQGSVKGWTDKRKVEYIPNRVLVDRKKEILMSLTRTNLGDIILSEISQFPSPPKKWTNTVIHSHVVSKGVQVTETKWMVVAGAMGREAWGVMGNGYSVSVLQDGRVLEICFTARWDAQHSWTGHLQMVKMLNFVRCVYHEKTHCRPKNWTNSKRTSNNFIYCFIGIMIWGGLVIVIFSHKNHKKIPHNHTKMLTLGSACPEQPSPVLSTAKLPLYLISKLDLHLHEKMQNQ